jgi:hypothetical protein
MPARKPHDEKPQYERFLEAAREHGTAEDPEGGVRACVSTGGEATYRQTSSATESIEIFSSALIFANHPRACTISFSPSR